MIEVYESTSEIAERFPLTTPLNDVRYWYDFLGWALSVGKLCRDRDVDFSATFVGHRARYPTRIYRVASVACILLIEDKLFAERVRMAHYDTLKRVADPNFTPRFRMF